MSSKGGKKKLISEKYYEIYYDYKLAYNYVEAPEDYVFVENIFNTRFEKKNRIYLK